MSDPRVIPLAVSVSFPAAPVTGATLYRNLICDPNGAGWVTLADANTGNAVSTLQVGPNNLINAGSIALITASGVFAKQLQEGNDALRPVESVHIEGDGTISPPIADTVGLAGASVLLLSDLQSGDFAAGRGWRPDAGSIADDSTVPAWLGTLGLGYGYDQASASWIPQAVASAPNLATFNGLGAQLATRPGEWTLTHAPAAATVATATRAAGAAGVRHVLTSFAGDLNAVAPQAVPLQFVVRDGAAGVGTILYQRRLIAPAGTSASFDMTDLNIVGSDATAMTVEVTAAPAATNFATVSASGYSVSTPPAPPPPPLDGVNITIAEHPTSPGAFGYGNASNGAFGNINDGALPAPYTLGAYIESSGDNVLIRIQGDSAAPAADAFTSFEIFNAAQVSVLGPVLFSTAGFTGISNPNEREWAWDTLSNALHTIGIGGTFTLVVTV